MSTKTVKKKNTHFVSKHKTRKNQFYKISFDRSSKNQLDTEKREEEELTQCKL